MQKLLLDGQRKQLLTNGRAAAAAIADDGNAPDHRPIVKLFTPWTGCTWLLSELHDDLAFGLCDLGMGEPELGYVSLAELRSIRGPGGLYIERDAHFTAKKTLREYAEAARIAGMIVE